MGDIAHKVADGLANAGLMFWEVWWALVLGFAISAAVQAWVPRSQIESALSGGGPRPVAIATGLGAASSSCSYAAIAIARSLFAKGASAASALAFQFASTNLVWELGLVLWVLIGWQFTLAEYVGGIVLIVLMTALLRFFVSPRLEERAREHAVEARDEGHHHDHGHGAAVRGLRTVAANFRADWSMLYREMLVGFVLAGFLGLLHDDFWRGAFVTDAPSAVQLIENVIAGPLIAIASFVCSIGNVPLAAVLWSGGISFAGVIAFIFADLVVLPIVVAYRKYYGASFAIRITALMLVAMMIAALAVDGLFSALGLIPSGPRPTRGDVFGSIQVDYKLALNVVGFVVFAGLMTLSRGNGHGHEGHGHSHHE
jgi:uncharacterized membrane protein YraQ (UPF0718 family)